MTMPSERTRALRWAGEFLLKVQKGEEFSDELKREVKFILRHYPEDWEIKHQAELDAGLASQLGHQWLGPENYHGKFLEVLKMKILVLSDLHVEFAPFVADSKTVAAADVVILAGDIHQGIKGLSWARQTFPHKPIVYVAGNHEFYGHHWDTLIVELRQEAKKYDIYFLENQTIILAGIRFLGATLWTDFEFFGKEKRSHMMRLTEVMLNDFKVIKASPLAEEFDDTGTSGVSYNQPAFAVQALSPEHTVVRHRESLAWLDAQLQIGDASKTVVITHHYPNLNSTAQKWAKNPLTAGFGSKLDLQMLSKCKLWIHGHTHDSFDYRVGESGNQVRVVCNPREYPRNRTSNTLENPNFNPQFLIDI